MPVIAANAEPQKVAGPGDASGEYDFRCEGNSILLAHSRQNARDPRTSKSRLRQGDRGTITREEGDEIWAYNDDLDGTGSDATLELRTTGFFVSFGSRPTVGAVQQESGAEAPAASDGFVHEYGTGVDVNAAAVVEEIGAPDRADKLKINVDDAAGAYHVEVEFLDSPGGTEITQRDDNNLSAYAGDATTDVFQTVDIASPYMRVKVVDDSGAVNEVDYSIYAR